MTSPDGSTAEVGADHRSPPKQTGSRHRKESTNPQWLRYGLLGAAVFALLAVVYVIDLVASSGAVPRGVVVAGVDLGGRDIDDAEALLRARISERIEKPLAFEAGDVTGDITVSADVLDVDWAQTLDRVGSQPLDPFTRIVSLFTDRHVQIASTVDEAALSAQVEGLRPVTDRAPVEGGVRFDGAQPIPVLPVAGQALDAAGAREALVADWADATPIELPVDVTDVVVDDAAVQDAVDKIAEPAVAADVVFTGRDGKVATLKPDQVGAVLTFTPNDSGGLTPQYNRDAAAALLAPQLAVTEVRPRDAVISVTSGAPVVTPAVVGDMVAWQKTLDGLPGLMSAPNARTAAAVYEPAQPALTTEAVNGLGIREVIAEYTTGGFEPASGVNIRKVAEVVNGAIVKPGDTFSLNGFTGPRGIEQGYVESGIIDHGRPAKAVGGGISQFATTLYNATYFAGLEDVTHTEHSYYISRYPEAREATVFEGAIDLAFRNNTQNGIYIEAVGSSSDVTVRIWGTKAVDVQSVTGDRYADTAPDTITLPEGGDCVASRGAPGFTTSNTRIITDHITGAEVYRHTRTVKYDPVPIVKCV
ncbi:VanW family protein [Antrihabitans sp. YC2-6]|uniref:VanW family protein n=1 Tax=Antrihabitans sp. YC2-6 TaxID=2799498 RepID=UPI001F386B3E|nr:VanW family protein [Antrihabitans sp. YC2-6]